MRARTVLALLLLASLIPASASTTWGYSATKTVTYKNIPLVIYSVTTKDGIDTKVSVEKGYPEVIEGEIPVGILLSGPSAKVTVPTVSTKCSVISEKCKSVKAIIEFWCNDLRTGWDVVGQFQGKGFRRVGMTRSDSLKGFWKVILVNTKTKETIGEVQVWVDKAKPTEFPYMMAPLTESRIPLARVFRV